MEHPYLNNSDPRVIASGLLIAVICAFLGAVVVIHFRDIAGRDDRRYEEPPHYNGRGSYAVGGYMCIFLFLVLGCASFFLLESPLHQMRLVAKVNNVLEIYSPKEPVQNSIQHSTPPVYSDKWVNDQFTADEAPYLRIRNEVDAQMTDYRTSERIGRKAEEAAFFHSDNPQMVYRWGYGAYKRAYHACYHITPMQRNEITEGGDQDTRQSEISQDLFDADDQMQRVSNPKSYSYSRLIFLLRGMKVFTRKHVPPAELADIKQGDYLIRYKPDDWDVKEALARMLATRRSKLFESRAIRYAQDVVSARPKSPQAWQTLGMVYISSAQISKTNSIERSEYIDKAIKAYKTCLRLAPSDYNLRESLESAIPTLRDHPQFYLDKTDVL